MIITYHAEEDSLLICFNQAPLISEVLHDPNIKVGLTDQGVGQITILAAKARGLLPVHVTPKDCFKKSKPSKKDKLVAKLPAVKEEKYKRKKRCCESYKRGKRCKNCPNTPSF